MKEDRHSECGYVPSIAKFRKLLLVLDRHVFSLDSNALSVASLYIVQTPLLIGLEREEVLERHSLLLCQVVLAILLELQTESGTGGTRL